MAWHAPCKSAGVRVVVYQNPDAGHERRRRDAHPRFATGGPRSRVWRHIKERSLDDPAREGSILVVAAGGDGSVGRSRPPDVGRDVPIAVLPLGTANNLAPMLDAGKHDLNARISAWNIVPFDAAPSPGMAGSTGSSKLRLGAFADTAAMLTARDAGVRPSRTERLSSRATSKRCGLAQLPETPHRLPARHRRPVQSGVAHHGRGAQHRPDRTERSALAARPTRRMGWLDVVLVGERERQALHGFLEACERSVRPATRAR